jgi:hypothetical protein
MSARFPRPVALLATTAALAVATAALSGGCRKKEFEPGVFQLVGVFQVARDADGDEANRSEMRLVGSATWTFDYDGEFLVEYHNYAVGFEQPCSGHLRGQYRADSQQLTLRTKKASVPVFCRPDAERVYTWQRGWGGTLTVERHWEENQYIAYRLEPVE